MARFPTKLVVMNSEVVRGAVGMASLTVRPADTSVAQGLNDLPVLATPTLVNLFEAACSVALAEHLGTGETSITSEITMTNRAAVGVGREIRAHATCAEVDGTVYKFTLESYQGSKLVACGTVSRRIVDRVSFSARIAAESMATE
jgi:fluoroacetyl-CoA thioesterase